MRFAPALLACAVVCSTGVVAGDEVLVRQVDFSSMTVGSNLAPGEPAVPRVLMRLVLPFGRDLAAATFRPRSGGTRRRGAYYPVVPYPIPMCGGGAPPPSAPLYAPTEVFPPAVLGDVEVVVKHGIRIAQVPLYPVRYFPATGEAERLAGGELRLELRAAAPSPLYRGLAEDHEDVRLLAEDVEALTSYPLPARSRGVDYLVIAPQEFIDDTDQNGLAALLAEKESRLLTTGTLSIESIQGRYAGRDLQEKVRNAIVSEYGTRSVRFVLLVGNGYSVLPTRKLNVKLSEGTLPSDLYFACLDGTFDGNGNGVFGEPNDGSSGDDVDLACEVAVGRAPVSTLAEMHAFVEKSLALQAITASDPRVRNALYFGEKLDGQTLGIRSLEQLRDGGQAGDIATSGYPASIEGTDLAESFTKQFSAAEVVRALNEGDFYTVNHLGHANQSYCMRFNASEIPKIRNELPFFGITQGCHPGDLRGPNWASKLVVSAVGGAGAMIANSNYGYYQPGGTDGQSHRLHLVFWDTVFSEYQKYLGRALYRAKERLIGQLRKDSYLRWVVYETNLLGDPELTLKF